MDGEVFPPPPILTVWKSVRLAGPPGTLMHDSLLSERREKERKKCLPALLCQAERRNLCSQLVVKEKQQSYGLKRNVT